MGILAICGEVSISKFHTDIIILSLGFSLRVRLVWSIVVYCLEVRVVGDFLLLGCSKF